jgi:hypothetical protein
VHGSGGDTHQQRQGTAMGLHNAQSEPLPRGLALRSPPLHLHAWKKMSWGVRQRGCEVCKEVQPRATAPPRPRPSVPIDLATPPLGGGRLPTTDNKGKASKTQAGTTQILCPGRLRSYRRAAAVTYVSPFRSKEPRQRVCMHGIHLKHINAAHMKRRGPFWRAAEARGLFPN